MKSYQQFCPVARALDVVGERWTLLIVRELLWGPKRYTDLQGGLPGIGPNVLADRLRALEAAGLVQKRRLDPPAASTVYELTELGEGLRPALMDLFRWGLQLGPSSGGEEAIRASYWLPAIEAAAHQAPLGLDIEDIYEFRIGDESVTVTVAGGEARARQGSPPSPDVLIRTDHETFAAIGIGRLTPIEAIEANKLSVEGEPAAAQRCAAIFGVVLAPDDPGRLSVGPASGTGP